MTNILLVKETRAGEQRVALVPKDIKELLQQDCQVFVESGAGKGIDIADAEYEKAGATIRRGEVKALFKDIDIIVRAKRPDREREIQEAKILSSNMTMIGALDPKESNSPHVDEYKQAGITAYSIEQLNLASDDPMNILASMSRIAGRLALQDAMSQCPYQARTAVIIGFGTAGQAAFSEAIKQGLQTTVIATSDRAKQEIESQGGHLVILNRDDALEIHQSIVAQQVVDADIVITSARRPGETAPLLIDENTLDTMSSGSVIVDLAISEGGNVAGSEHDKTITTNNGVIITNQSGYPKAEPRVASEYWSQASLLVVLRLLKDPQDAELAAALIS